MFRHPYRPSHSFPSRQYNFIGFVLSQQSVVVTIYTTCFNVVHTFIRVQAESPERPHLLFGADHLYMSNTEVQNEFSLVSLFVYPFGHTCNIGHVNFKF